MARKLAYGLGLSIDHQFDDMDLDLLEKTALPVLSITCKKQCGKPKANGKTSKFTPFSFGL